MTEHTPGDAPTVEEFAVVEIFGHRRLVGRIQEVERFGAKLLRIDVPTEGDFAKGFVSQFYGGASLFSVTPCSAEYCERANKPYRPAGLLRSTPEGDTPLLGNSRRSDYDDDHPF